jgi:CubicO group peptidase (beta-lactamase class C family)
MGLNPLIDYDWNFTDFTARLKELGSQGFRPLSLSMYGDLSDLRFSAVFDKRSGPAWRWNLGYTVADLRQEYNKNKTAGFYPALIAATGGGNNTRMSAVFEKLESPKTRELTFDQDVNTFRNEVRNRAKDGWMIMSATIYDDAMNEAKVSAVWAKNSGNVGWTAFAGMDAGLHQQQFNAEWSGWARLSFVTASTQGRFLAVYRDDQIGPIGTSFVARHNLTLEQFLSEQSTWLKKGFHTVCFQGYGLAGSRRYAAIFVNNENPVQRTSRATGGPVVPEIDNAVFDLMKRSNIRGAALAIVKGTKLVLARGYTWAEPDYPNVEPTTCFRLGSGSKLVAALGIHQLVAEGLVKLTDKVSTVLPLTTPDGKPPANTKYQNGTVAQLLEASSNLSPRYEGEGPNIVAAFKTKLPVKHSQIASFMITKPTFHDPNPHLDDFGYFLAGQVIKKLRAIDANKSIMDAIAARLTSPLQIKRLRAGQSLLSTQLPDEARFHSRDLELHESVMDDSKSLVPREYGDENLETMETSGGLSGAVTDLARILAAMNAKPYTPLGRPAVDQLLKSAASVNGHGFDWLAAMDAANGPYNGPKGGLLQSAQAGIWYSSNDFSYVIVWNGLHTGNTLELHPDIGSEWYPKFTKVLEAAANQVWSATDMFPTYKMDSFPPTQDNWRWCNKCQGLFFAGNNLGSCPAGSTHVKSGSGNYTLMQNSKLAYGQANWRWCNKCQGLFFGTGQPGKCPQGGLHDQSTSGNYSLVLNSPYKEHQQNWRWCNKCQGLFFNSQKVGICSAGGSHDPSSSGNYSLA